MRPLPRRCMRPGWLASVVRTYHVDDLERLPTSPSLLSPSRLRTDKYPKLLVRLVSGSLIAARYKGNVRRRYKRRIFNNAAESQHIPLTIHTLTYLQDFCAWILSTRRTSNGDRRLCIITCCMGQSHGSLFSRKANATIETDLCSNVLPSKTTANVQHSSLIIWIYRRVYRREIAGTHTGNFIGDFDG